MRKRFLVLLRWGRWQLQPWIKLIFVTIETVSHPHQSKEKLHAALAKVNLLPVVESFQEFLDDLPLWFY